MNKIWKRWAMALIVFLSIGTVVEALSCSALANAMFSSRHRTVYWAKRYYAAGCGFAVALNLPAGEGQVAEARSLPLWDETDSRVSTEKEDDDLAQAMKAFLEKDYQGAIEHAKRKSSDKSYVASRIVGVSACAIKDNDGIREALAGTDDEGKELIKFACDHYGNPLQSESAAR
jgi:hypothetical protein